MLSSRALAFIVGRLPAWSMEEDRARLTELDTNREIHEGLGVATVWLDGSGSKDGWLVCAGGGGREHEKGPGAGSDTTPLDSGSKRERTMRKSSLMSSA